MPELIKSKLKAYGKETVLQFIQGRIKENDDFLHDFSKSTQCTVSESVSL